MRPTISTSKQRAALFASALCLLCWLAGCGGGKDGTAVLVGQHAITADEVDHWISVLKAEGNGGRQPGPPAPVPPHYTACLAYARAHQSSIPASTPEIPKEPRAYCEFEYRRFKLKALYLLIAHQWVRGAAAELGIRPNRPELARELASYRKGLGLTSAAAYKRYLRFLRANPSDLLSGLEVEQLIQAVEAKVAGSAKTPAQRQAALAQFGKAYKAKWLARTDCNSGYVVPVCRQYKRGKTPPPMFVPPSVPLTGEPSRG